MSSIAIPIPLSTSDLVRRETPRGSAEGDGAERRSPGDVHAGELAAPDRRRPECVTGLDEQPEIGHEARGQLAGGGW